MDLTALGAAGIFIVLVLRMLLDFLGKQKRAKEQHPVDVLDVLERLAKTMDSQARLMTKMASQMSDLHRWHAPNDQGKQPWKFDLEGPLDELSKAINGLSHKIDTLAA